MGRERRISDGLAEVGAGTAMGVVWLGAITGFLPGLALTAVFALPLVAVGLAVALVVAPPYAVWRLLGRGRRRRRWERGAAAP